MAEIVVRGLGNMVELALAGWLDAKSNRSGSTKTKRAYEDAVSSFRSFLRAQHEDVDSDSQIVALAAQAWAGHGDPAPATFNQRLAILSSLYTYACTHGLLRCDNPIARVDRRPVQGYADAQALDYNDLKQRLAQIDRSTLRGKRDYALLAVALQTGRRLSEVANLCWKDLRIGRIGASGNTGGKVTMHWRRTKGGKQMHDTLPKPVSAALLDYLHNFYGAALGDLDPDAPVWVSLSRRNYGQGMTIQTVADVCEKHLGTSKVHTLRHTFARAMEDAGAKVSDIQARLGHSSLATTGRYLAALKQADNAHGDPLADMFGIRE